MRREENESSASHIGLPVSKPTHVAHLHSRCQDHLKISAQKATLYQHLVMMTSPAVTLIGLKALAKGKASVVPGLLNKLTLLSNRFMPRVCIPPMVHRLMKNH